MPEKYPALGLMMVALVYGNASKRLVVMSAWELINHVLRSNSDVKTSTSVSGFKRYGPLFESILRCLQLHGNLQFEAD